MASVTAIAAMLNRVLVAVPAEQARSSGFCQRHSKLDAASFVQTAVLGWLHHPSASLAQLTAVAAQQGVAISPQGLDQRFGAAGATLLERVLAATVALIMGAAPSAATALDAFSAVLVLDSTTITLPDALAARWAGCGGRVAHQGRAAVKITVQLDLRGGAITGVELGAGRTQDRSSALLHAPLPEGAVRVADLGFSALGVFAKNAEHHAFFLSRLHPQTRLFRAGASTPLDLEAWLASTPGAEQEMAVELGVTQRAPARLLVMRVPAAVAEARAASIRARARRAGERPSPTALARTGWQVLVTNVPAPRLSLHAAVALMRARWQIELVFKRWKSQGKLDEWRSRKPDRVRCEIYAKLIALLIEHWLAVGGTWTVADRSLSRADSVIRSWALWLGRALGRPRALRTALTELFRLLQGCPRLTKRAKPNSAQLLMHPDLVAFA